MEEDPGSGTSNLEVAVDPDTPRGIDGVLPFLSPPAAGRGGRASISRVTGPGLDSYRFCQYLAPALGHGGSPCDCMTCTHVD
jgi:hypothetical protein